MPVLHLYINHNLCVSVCVLVSRLARHFCGFNGKNVGFFFTN